MKPDPRRTIAAALLTWLSLLGVVMWLSAELRSCVGPPPPRPSYLP